MPVSGGPGQGQGHDLAALPSLDEKIMMEEFRRRFASDVIYTYLGDIIVALNPYRPLPLYDKEMQLRYRNLKLRADLPPHLYALSDRAYCQLRMTGRPQCLVVSGESGAGKTEATKILVEHMVHLCGEDTTSHLHQRIIEVNPLLEAFGNARTAMNNNSSRFGKFIDLRYSRDGRVLGAHISEYLLEKSRVVSHGVAEQNFHIFYYLFAGLSPEELNYNSLRRPEHHRILLPTDGTPIFLDESEFLFHRRQWDRLRDVMDNVGFTSEELNGVLALLAAVLHLTDIQFQHDPDTDGVFILDEEGLEIASMLLQVSPEELASNLISNVTVLRGERIVSLKTVFQANDGRDALAKSLYGRLFGWIVRQVNHLLKPPAASDVTSGASVGILDIAGFENFLNNSFEQLCINAANEQLQVLYNAAGFLEKNRDTLSSNLLETMTSSDSQLVSDLYTAYISDTGQMELK